MRPRTPAECGELQEIATRRLLREEGHRVRECAATSANAACIRAVLAKKLGISERSLYRKLREIGFESDAT